MLSRRLERREVLVIARVTSMLALQPPRSFEFVACVWLVNDARLHDCVELVVRVLHRCCCYCPGHRYAAP